MRLSVVDLATVAPGTTQADALADAVATARHAERLGYHRAWFAEHHLSRSGASHYPELLIATVAALTSTIRVGSGAVLMNHRSPFAVAETYQQLEAMAPGRVDLGMGRATAGPVLDAALQQNRQHPAEADHGQQILETLAWLHEAFPEEHPFHDHPLMPGVPGRPEAWLLGSSPGGSELAAALGIGYTFAGFINPGGAAGAIRHYRDVFRPRGFGFDAPQAILAVNVAVGETDADGLHLVNSAKGYYAGLRRAGRAAGSVMVPSADEAARTLNDAEKDEPTTITDGRWPRFVAGGPERVRATLEQMVAESGADEIMVQDLVADPVDRRRSHELLAGAFGLEAPPEPAAATDGAHAR